MSDGNLHALTWKKSSFSDTRNCVEVAAPALGDLQVHVRDSNDAEGPSLIFATASWDVFLRALGKEGHEFPVIPADDEGAA